MRFCFFRADGSRIFLSADDVTLRHAPLFQLPTAVGIACQGHRRGALKKGVVFRLRGAAWTLPVGSTALLCFVRACAAMRAGIAWAGSRAGRRTVTEPRGSTNPFMGLLQPARQLCCGCAGCALLRPSGCTCLLRGCPLLQGLCPFEFRDELPDVLNAPVKCLLFGLVELDLDDAFDAVRSEDARYADEVAANAVLLVAVG